MMERDKLIAALRRVSVETGSLACLGCGYEHNCGVHGCRILQEAVAMLENDGDRRSRSNVLSKL